MRIGRHGLARCAGQFGAVVLVLASAYGARAEPAPEQIMSAPARELWVQGNQFWESGKFLEAADRFDRAYEVEHSPFVGLWVARSLARARQFLDALAHYRELCDTPLPADAPGRDWAAQRDAQREVAELEPRIPKLVVQVAGAPANEVRVTINGEPLAPVFFGIARQMDPGALHLRAVRGNRVIETTVELEEAQAKTVNLDFARIPDPESLSVGTDSAFSTRERTSVSGQRVIAYVALGIGGAALLTGSAFGWMALSDQSTLDEQCPRSRCPADLKADVDAYGSKKTIAAVGLISGAALLTAGTVLYFTLPASDERPRQRAGAALSVGRAVVWATF